MEAKMEQEKRDETKNKKLNQLAWIGALVWVVSVLLQQISGIFGIITAASFFIGLTAFLQIKKTNERGRFLAFLTMILGGISLVGVLSAVLSVILLAL